MQTIKTKISIWIYWLVINTSYLTTGLKDVHVSIPAAVKRGENAVLSCFYDLEEDTLYSIKWYKGKREFYRYTLRENPPIKVFAVNGIEVERSMSNASFVALISVEPTVSGKYSCEVSADAPSFHTIIVSGDLEVVDVPNMRPIIDGIRKTYSVGDIIKANCTLNGSKPAANLTWIINNETVNQYQVIFYRDQQQKDLTKLQSITIGLKVALSWKHFRSKNLNITCRGQLYNIYDKSTEKIIELNDINNIAFADDSNASKSYKSFQKENHIQRQHDIQLQQIQDLSSSASRSIGISLGHILDERTKKIFCHIGVPLMPLAGKFVFSLRNLGKIL